ncbi:MAG: glycosyl transferase family 2, partial [Deinococcales bacterium]
VVRKSLYEEVGGLDEVNLPVTLNDVDFCLKLLEAGYRNLWTPHAMLYHHESKSRPSDYRPEQRERYERERAYMKARWADLIANDPAYNPNLTLDTEDFALSAEPRVEKPWLAFKK